ncbi:MAG: dihydrofolate reductase family protein [Gemmatimonadaceae bacterium]
MRKLIVSSFVSLDGVTEAPWTWTGSYFDDESREYSLNKLADVEFFLLGRRTYETFSATWPNVKDNEYMDRVNGLKKLVASKTLENVTWNASLLAGDAAGQLANIKKEPGGNIMKYGISELDRTLLANKLVDEYHLWIIPKYVGKGKRAFDDVDPSLVHLDLIDTQRLRNGSVILKYAPR